MRNQNIILLAAAALIAAIPLFMTIEGDDVFAGADEQAEAMVEELRPDYTPWAEALWEPPSGEIESLLFMLQAGLGAGLLGYYLGLRRGESRAREGRTGGERPLGQAGRAGGTLRNARSNDDN
jgi:cobalt/nickel transport protein